MTLGKSEIRQSAIYYAGLLGQRDKQIIDQESDVPSFILFIDLGHSKLFSQWILQEIMKKDNTWNIRRLVDDSFVPLSKQPSVTY